MIALMRMRTVNEIKRQILKLKGEDLADFASWFRSFVENAQSEEQGGFRQRERGTRKQVSSEQGLYARHQSASNFNSAFAQTFRLFE